MKANQLILRSFTESNLTLVTSKPPFLTANYRTQQRQQQQYPTNHYLQQDRLSHTGWFFISDGSGIPEIGFFSFQDLEQWADSCYTLYLPALSLRRSHFNK